MLNKYILRYKNLARRPIIHKTASAMFTQGMLSVMNFVIGFATAKFATKSEYGVYVVLFSILGIPGGIQNSLINNPCIVLVPKKLPEEKDLFITGLGSGQWLIFIPLMAFLLFAVFIYSNISNDRVTFEYGLVLVFSILASLLREFYRTLNYINMKILSIVKIDIVFVIIIIIGISALIFLDKVTSSTAIALLGIGYLISAVYAYISDDTKFIFNCSNIKKSFLESWPLSRWSLISVTSALLQNRGYIYIVTLMLGIEDVAEISAARLFLMPLGFLIVSTGKITLAKGADLFEKNNFVNLKKYVYSIIIFLIFIWICYIIFLMVFYDSIITYAFAGKYSNLFLYILIWATYFLIYIIRFPINRAIMAAGEFKLLSYYDVLSASITILACLLLIKNIGSYGAILSLLIGEIVLLILVFPKFRVLTKPQILVC